VWVAAIAKLSQQRREVKTQTRRRAQDEKELNMLSSFFAEAVEAGIPASIENCGPSHGVWRSRSISFAP
jgi:hypothetical protein